MRGIMLSEEKTKHCRHATPSGNCVDTSEVASQPTILNGRESNRFAHSRTHRRQTEGDIFKTRGRGIRKAPQRLRQLKNRGSTRGAGPRNVKRQRSRARQTARGKAPLIAP